MIIIGKFIIAFTQPIFWITENFNRILNIFLTPAGGDTIPTGYYEYLYGMLTAELF